MEKTGDLTVGQVAMSFDASSVSYCDANYCHFSHPHSRPESYVIFMRTLGQLEAIMMPSKP